MKLCHLHLQDGFGNPKTLICNLIDGSIRYISYLGWGDSGMGNSLSNFSCHLPMDKETETETKDEFVQRLIGIINTKSVYRVVKEINTQITF
jgi:hypothetical protein